MQYPVLEEHARADACVVGLGGSGLACIDELLRAGLSVVGVDAGTVACGAAGRNGGLLRAGGSLFHHEARTRYGVERARWIYAVTAAERERILRDMPSLARRCGVLRLAYDRSEVADCRAQLEALRVDGFDAEWYDGPLGQGMLVRSDAAVDPLARCRSEAAAVASAGARLYEQSKVHRIAEGLVETTQGSVKCRAIVVAVDGALPTLLPELAGRVSPMRLQMLASTGHPPGLLPHALSVRSGWDYAQQLEDGRIAFGGCRDAGGGDERTTSTEPSVRVQAALQLRFKEVLGGAPTVTHRWAATAGYTTSGLPVAGHVRPGVWACGGYSGTGNLLGAVCGRIVARLAFGIAAENPFA